MATAGFFVSVVGAVLSALAFWQAGRARTAARQAARRISGKVSASHLERLPLIHLGLETWVLREDPTGVRWSIHQWVDAAAELTALLASDDGVGPVPERLQLTEALNKSLDRVPLAYAGIEAGETLLGATRGLRAEMLVAAIAATTIATALRVELPAEEA